MRISFLIGLAFLSYQFVRGQIFEVENIHSSGDIFKRINVVIVGDGYQEHEMGTFVIDATIFANTLLNESPLRNIKITSTSLFLKSLPMRVGPVIQELVLM